jgi:hypothetical protein
MKKAGFRAEVRGFVLPGSVTPGKVSKKVNPYAPACLPGDAADMMLRALMDIT